MPEVWVTIPRGTSHAVYFGGGSHTEFMCGKERDVKELRVPRPTDKKCIRCLAYLKNKMTLDNPT